VLRDELDKLLHVAGLEVGDCGGEGLECGAVLLQVGFYFDLVAAAAEDLVEELLGGRVQGKKEGQVQQELSVKT
jgi:hypothetical protein